MVKEQAPIFLLFLFLNFKLFKGCLPQFYIVHSWRHCSICISSKKYAISSDIQNESAENGTAIHQLTWLSLPVIRQKDESRSWGNKNTKHAQFKKKNKYFLPPDTHMYICVLGVRNIRFSENFTCFVFLLPLFWDSPFCLITDKLLYEKVFSDFNRIKFS